MKQINISPWYGVRTRSNQEKLVAAGLQAKGYEIYLPSYRDRRRWSDRTVEVQRPIFPGYLFCRLDPQVRVPVISTPGVVNILSFGNTAVPVPDSEIDAIHALLDSDLGAKPHPFIQEGDRVRVTSGSLSGLEGLLVKKKNEWRFVISIAMLQRAVAIEIDQGSVKRI